jgi:hypothetical protein
MTSSADGRAQRCLRFISHRWPARVPPRATERGACENRFGSIGAMRRISSCGLRVLREELRHLTTASRTCCHANKEGISCPHQQVSNINFQGFVRRQMTSFSESLRPGATEFAQWRATSSRTGWQFPVRYSLIAAVVCAFDVSLTAAVLADTLYNI